MLSESAERAGTSIWRPSLPPVEQESLGCGRNEEVVDLAVVGGGFTGLSAAYHALTAHPGMRVVLLEGERIGHGASSRNSGMLTPGVGQNLAALVKRFGADAARAMYRRSLAIRERSYPPDHPGTLASRAGYADALRAEGRSADAVAVERRGTR